MKWIREFLKAVLAGCAIGIGGAVYLNCDNKYVGAFFFCVGLITVVYFGLNLFTGKVGYVEGIRDVPRMILYIVGNTVGAALPGLLAHSAAVPIVEAKLALPFYIVFIKAIFCGVLMYIAVELFKSRNTVLGILFGVPAFILAGFEHSIADMFYFAASGYREWNGLWFLLIVILGNAIGGMLLPLLERLGKWCDARPAAPIEAAPKKGARKK